MDTKYKIITDTKNPLCGKTYEEVLKLADNTLFLLSWVYTQTPELCLASVKRYGITLKYVEKQTLEICTAALKQNIIAVKYIDPLFYKELGICSLAFHIWHLVYHQNSYYAGCHGPWSAEQALKHWNEYHHDQERATLFTKVIIENEIALKYSPEEKLYFVVCVTEKTKERIKMHYMPVTHEEAIAIRSKITAFPSRALELEEYIRG